MPLSKKIFNFIYLFGFILFPLVAHSITLEETLSSSLINNLEIKKEKSTLSVAKENINQSISSYFPSISLQGSISESEVTNIKSQSGSLSS